jgi:hypothetical protein
MPNWCYNTLQINGEKEEMDKFYSILKKKPELQIVTKRKDLESNKLKHLEELKNKDNGSWVRNNLQDFLDIKGLSIEEYYTKHKSLVFDDKGNACREPADGMLEKFFPMPDKIEVKGNSVMPDWYNWRVSNWGTKWDVDIHIDVEDENELFGSFDSAWSPPVEWLKKVSKDFPKLHFILNYEESGVGFKGTFEICVEDGLYDDMCQDWYGDCGECEEDYDSEGKCGCVGENDKPLQWGEECDWEEEVA